MKTIFYTVCTLWDDSLGWYHDTKYSDEPAYPFTPKSFSIFLKLNVCFVEFSKLMFGIFTDIGIPCFLNFILWYDALFQIKPSWECYWLWSWECECAEWWGNENVCLITQQIPSHVRGSIQCFYSVLSMSMITLQIITMLNKYHQNFHVYSQVAELNRYFGLSSIQ